MRMKLRGINSVTKRLADGTERTYWYAWRGEAGIRGLTFHDLRGTAVVTLARAGCTEVEIYSITGHKPGDVQAILTTHYLPRDAEVAGNAIAKLNRYRGTKGGRKSSNCVSNCVENQRSKSGEIVTRTIGWGARI